MAEQVQDTPKTQGEEDKSIGTVAIIGAGPAGLAGARNLQRMNIPFTGYELHSDVGGLWDIDNPNSTMYESAHLISSKKMTEFHEFPMKDEVADYPSHRELCRYFQDFATEYDLRKHYKFETRVIKVEPQEQGWTVTTEGGESTYHSALIIANGTLSEPNLPTWEGEFSGEFFHSSKYRSADVFEDKRVLIIGAGNSGCDIAVDAIHRAKKVSMSVRRGYHFVPKYVFGRPADAVGGIFRLPFWIKQKVDTHLLKWFTGDPVRLGFPEPDHKLYESHPIVNSLVLYHLGHGDIEVKEDIKRFDGDKVHFVDDTSEEYDVVVAATGYKLHYPFIDSKYLCWSGEGGCPNLFLQTFHPERDDLFILGLMEAAGIGWQGRYEQAELVAKYIAKIQEKSRGAEKFKKAKEGTPPDLRGGVKYMKLDRMAYYVHKETFLKYVRKYNKWLK